MSVPQGDAIAVDRLDDLSRQRQKRAARLLDRPVPGFGDLDMRGLIRQTLAAIEERGGELDVASFLIDRGHHWETVATVLVSLGLTDTTHPSPGVSLANSVATGAGDADDEALELRCEGRSFVQIARELGLDRATEAIAAFRRSLRRRPPAEQERLLGEELRRLDALAARIHRDAALDAPADRSLGAVDRIHAMILAM